MSSRETRVSDEECDYATREDVNRAILNEIAKIRFKERLPRIVEGLARHLVAAGVDFSKVDWSKVSEPTDAEMDAIYEDFK